MSNPPGSPIEHSTTNRISFITANYVARQIGFNMTEGWGQGDRATNEYFRPIETFAERFGKLLDDIRAMGFEAIDLWNAHLHWAWATEEHIASARDLLARHGLRVLSLAGGFGATPDELDRACKLAVAMDAPLLAGSTTLLSKDRAATVAILKQHGVRLAIENHPGEKTPADVLRQIGDGGDGMLGTAVDTGWWGTQGYDAAKAIEELWSHILCVHLKDVLAAGAHETCRFGRGVVPIEACVRTLQHMGYQGSYGIEHEPDHYDPSEDCRAVLQMLRGWLA